MTLTQLNNEIETYLLVREIDFDEEYIAHTAALAYESNYIQIIYDYGIDILLVILEIIESNEFYEQCLVLIQAIKDYNELEGESLPTTYIKDEQIKK